MNFIKGKGALLIVAAIVLVVLNIAAFVLPLERGEGFWTGYGFVTLSVLLAAVVAFFTLGHEGLKSKFYGWPLVWVVWAYLAVQVVAGWVEMAVPAIPFQYGIVLNVILLGACLIGLIGATAGRAAVERVDEKVRGKVFYIQALQSDVEEIASCTNDDFLKKALQDLAETFRYSDPVSGPQLAALENIIAAKVSALGGNAAQGSKEAMALCDELQQLLAERNRKTKLMK